jgi:hypothetical protein
LITEYLSPIRPKIIRDQGSSGLAGLCVHGLVRHARAARNATVRLGRLPGHDLKIVGAEEADEDALTAVIPVHAWDHRDVAVQADSRGLPRLVVGFGRRGGGRSRGRGGGRLRVITLVSRTGRDALSWPRRRCRRGGCVVTPLVSHTSPIGCRGLPGGIRPGGWHDSIAPAPTGLPTTTTTGLATTGLATTGLATTGLATTGLATTGLATTGLATTGLATTGLRTTGLRTTGLRTTGLGSCRGRAVRSGGHACLPGHRWPIRLPRR